MTIEFWLAQIEPIKHKIKQYEASEIALTKQDASILYKELYFWKDKCEHWKTKEKQTYYDRYEYCGHLEWNYLETFCVYCDKSLRKESMDR